MAKMTLEKLATMTMNGFRDLEARIDIKFSTEIDRLDKKIDYRFDALSARIDDLSLNRATWQEHNALAKRVDGLEEEIF